MAIITKLSDDFSEFMINTISIYPYSSKNKFGEKTYGSVITPSPTGIIIQKLVQLSDKDNQKVDSNSQIFIDGNISITIDDKIVFNGLTPEIKYIKNIPDENGIYAKIIYI